MKCFKALKKYIFHKDAGNVVSDMIPFLMMMLFFTLLIMVTIGWSGDLSRKVRLDDLSRQYIMQMDDVGYLSNELKAEYTNHLQSLGCHNVSFTGSTVAPVKYGEKIILHVQYDIPVSDIDLSNGILHIAVGTKYVHSSEQKEIVSRR